MAFAYLKKAHLLAPLFVLPALLSGCDGIPVGSKQDPVVGGADTPISDVPYQVALLDGLGQFCGGSILSDEWVITANHCVQDDVAGKIFVLAGVTKISEQDEGQKVKVVEVHQVPGFTGDTRRGKDVALIRLLKPLKFGKNVQPIEIVTDAADKAGLQNAGVLGRVSGWGVTNPEGFGGGADHLQSVEVPIIELSAAQDAYKHRLSKDQLAAAIMGVGGKDACFGDSGGPFVVKKQSGDGVLLAGTVSWGQSCATPEFPGMYGKVSFHEKFITDTMKLPKQPLPPVLVINEILADPGHDANGDGKTSSQDEFIEIVNMGDAAINLSGATLSNGSKVLHTFAAGTELAVGKVLVVFGGGKPKLAGVQVVIAPLSLKNKGETLKIALADGKVLAEVTYGSMADEDQSITRLTDGDPSAPFVLHTVKAGTVASPGTDAKGNSFE